MPESDDEFEEQLRQEADEKKRKEDINAGKVKVDPDGTVYEWDEEKKAWFPRLDEDFIARYQMSYGTSSATATDSVSTEGKNIPPAPSVDDPGYAEWYYKYYSNTEGSTTVPYDINSKEYHDWYNYYYGESKEKGDGSKEKLCSNSNENKGLSAEDNNKKETTPDSSSTVTTGKSDKVETGNEKQEDYSDYYAYYYQHYGKDNVGDHNETINEKDKKNNPVNLDPAMAEYWNQYHSSDFNKQEAEVAEDDPGKQNKDQTGKKGKKRKEPPPKEPPKWFEVDESKNTNVYVAGLPESMTEEAFTELMNKFGLIMFDPLTKKPKIKLYKDADGKNKGDGRCCFIKPESVDLALQILDGSDVDGYKVSVEKATFQLKGAYDPKKKKKLTNSQKKKMKKNQEKLFDWRPDKMRGARSKNERVVVIKNIFDPVQFEETPTLINEIRQDLREECQKFGDVKKIMIFDRHLDGVATVNFKEAEEADVCIETLNRRYFAGRRLIVEVWDGKSKFEVEETAEQEADRLKQWENFLQDDNKTVPENKSANNSSKDAVTGIDSGASAAIQEDAGSASS